jgi:hypothetical protein
MDSEEIKKILATVPSEFLYRKSFAQIAGTACGGIFLAQLYQWMDYADSNGYVCKTYQEWHEQTHLSLWEWEQAKQHLKEIGVIDCRRFGMNPTLHYRLNFDVLIDKLLTLQN